MLIQVGRGRQSSLGRRRRGGHGQTGQTVLRLRFSCALSASRGGGAAGCLLAACRKPGPAPAPMPIKLENPTRDSAREMLTGSREYPGPLSGSGAGPRAHAGCGPALTVTRIRAGAGSRPGHSESERHYRLSVDATGREAS